MVVAENSPVFNRRGQLLRSLYGIWCRLKSVFDLFTVLAIMGFLISHWNIVETSQLHSFETSPYFWKKKEKSFLICKLAVFAKITCKRMG